MKISISNVNWFSKVEFLKTPMVSFQFEILLPFHLQQVANGYLNLKKMNKIDSNITKSKLKSYQKKDNENRENCILEMEMIWIWGIPMKRTNICSFIYYPNELIYFSKPIKSTKEWFQKDDEILEYFEYEIIILSELKSGFTKFQHILCLSSTENIDWKKTILERSKSFLPSLYSSCDSSKKSIVDCKEMYLELNEKEEPKDAIGMMLYNLDVDKFDKETYSLISDDSMTETSFLDDSESESSFLVDSPQQIILSK